MLTNTTSRIFTQHFIIGLKGYDRSVHFIYVILITNFHQLSQDKQKHHYHHQTSFHGRVVGYHQLRSCNQ